MLPETWREHESLNVMIVHSTVSTAALVSCGDNPCFQRIDAFFRCVKPMGCRRSTLRQSRHQLAVLDPDGHHRSLGGTSDGFVVAGRTGVSPLICAMTLSIVKLVGPAHPFNTSGGIMIEDGHAQQVFIASIVKVIYQLECSSHRPGSTCVFVPVLEGPSRKYEDFSCVTIFHCPLKRCLIAPIISIFGMWIINKLHQMFNYVKMSRRSSKMQWSVTISIFWGFCLPKDGLNVGRF